MRPSRRAWLWGAAAVLTIWTVLRFVFQRGMFVDGITYAVVSRNLSEGLGTAWRPHYTATNAPVFEGHPPLAFWVQSWGYRLWGDVFWWDGLYGLVLVGLTVVVLGVSWAGKAPAGWLALLAAMTPLLAWSAANNMLENLLSLFALLAVVCIVRGMQTLRPLWWLAGSACVLLAWWSKGPVGLFPLAVPLWWWIAQGRSGLSANAFWRSVGVSGLGLIAWLGLWVWCFPESVDFVRRYLAVQLSPALQNELHVTTNYRMHILWVALQQMIVPSAMGIGLLWWGHRNGLKIGATERRMAIFWGMVAASAVLPLMLTLKQRRFYLVPAVWAGVMAWAYATAPIVSAWVEAMPRRWWRLCQIGVLVLGLIGLGLTVRDAGKESRDLTYQKAASAVAEYVPSRATIGVSAASMADWRLHGYLMRYGQVSIAENADLDWQLRPAGDSVNRATVAIVWRSPEWVLYRQRAKSGGSGSGALEEGLGGQ